MKLELFSAKMPRLACYKLHFHKMTVIKTMYSKKYKLKLSAKHSFAVTN